MDNLEINEKLISMKLEGSLDNYKELSKTFNMEEKELKKLGKTIKDIVINKLNISFELFTKYEQENPNIQYIKGKCTEERILGSLDKETKIRNGGFQTKLRFYKWYLEQPKSCCYCGISEELLADYFEKNKDSKRFQRGKSLEIERILTDKNNNHYSEDNCSLACYLCNNAKSDLIYYQNFKYIAKGINNFWKNEFPEKDIIFPEEFYKVKI